MAETENNINKPKFKKPKLKRQLSEAQIYKATFGQYPHFDKHEVKDWYKLISDERKDDRKKCIFSKAEWEVDKEWTMYPIREELLSKVEEYYDQNISAEEYLIYFEDQRMANETDKGLGKGPYGSSNLSLFKIEIDWTIDQLIDSISRSKVINKEYEILMKIDDLNKLRLKLIEKLENTKFYSFAVLKFQYLIISMNYIEEIRRIEIQYKKTLTKRLNNITTVKIALEKKVRFNSPELLLPETKAS